ncbi:MAG: hypothetical protein D6725_12445, partial [Planctomycetota bacterium]
PSVHAPDARAASPLPAGWDVTSDALAAWVALRWAAELLLVKSVPCPSGEASSAARDGLVDDAFPMLAPMLRRVWWLNLRSSASAPEPWLEHGRALGRHRTDE